MAITAAADIRLPEPFILQFCPWQRTETFISHFGKVGGAPSSYTDTKGTVWWNDLSTDQPLALFPDYSSEDGAGPWTGANSADAPGIYTQGELGTSQNDLHFPIWVPNGTVTGTVYMANFSPSANRQGFSFDCNGNRVMGVSDTYTYTGSKGAHSAASLTCSQNVTDGMLHMVLRWQGVNLQADSAAPSRSITRGWMESGPRLVISPGG